MDILRESWTDERLDYLNHKVDEGFRQVDKRFDRLESRIDQMDARFEQMNDRMLDLHRLIIQGGIAMFGAMLVGFMTVLATTL
jgi:hypothetical protein